ncbi:hypothetical protein BC939DRAFT_459931 [Gamsiella multidivaricata]|uniref:uncharacterized protein n=1 Tax=Gamsiella multidivaricata TaxID=101098 RepID=UPI00221FDCD7|nr:uncharacterized protein BC939DRAFT_459931 [Gamsiella multidivaricata]KAI7819483.1 hypothetical protein BC939DRAFT_459931 [Gamsiella multidivaricata]
MYDVQMADLWSLGIILINLLYHRCPWSDPCPQESVAFSEFLRSRVDFLQRRFEDMPGPVARWLALRVFAFVGAHRFKRQRSRPGISEWKSWMVDFVPRMLGQIESDVEEEEEYDDREEYREYLDLYENDSLGQEVEGDEILDDSDDDDNQVVPIVIQSSSLKDKQHLHLDPGRAYASYHVPVDGRIHSSFTSSSMPKFDPSAFYQPARLRQESWSDAIDMEGTEDAEMDFSAPILFEESDDEGQINTPEIDYGDDSSGLAVALPDDFIDPLPEPSAASSGRQTPSTPSMTHLMFNSEKRQLPAHFRLDLDLSSQHSSQDSSKRSAGRGSPGLESNDQINTLVFIEPDVSRASIDDNQNAAVAGGHAIASSLPSTSHMEAALGPGSALNKERVLLKQQMRKPARNLQDVKAVPFVFPPLKNPAISGNPITDSIQNLTPSLQPKKKSSMSQLLAKSDYKGPGLNEPHMAPPTKSGVYVIPKRSQLGPWPGPSAESGTSRPIEADVTAERSSNWRKSHHRGGSWTSIDDTWPGRKDSSARGANNGGRIGSGMRRGRDDKEDGHAGLPPRVENKFRPRYRQGQGRRMPPNANTSGLPPAPPITQTGFNPSRLRHQSRSGTVFDNNLPSIGSGAPGSEIEPHRSDLRNVNRDHQPQHQSQHQSQHQPKYENSQLRMHSKSSSGSTASKLDGQRNKSLVDLRAMDAASQPWRQPAPATTVNLNATSSTASAMGKAKSQAGAGDSSQRKGSQGNPAVDQGISSLLKKNRMAEKMPLTEGDAPKDNVYHPPHWHERNNSSSSNPSRRPSSGYESDITGWQKQDGGAPLSFSPKNRSASKGRLGGGGHPVGHSIASPPVERKQAQGRTADSTSNWRAGDTGDNVVQTDAQPSVSSMLAIKNEDMRRSPLIMTLIPPTPNVIDKPEFLMDTPANVSKASEPSREQDAVEPKKIVKPGTMTGLGNMLRGLVAYNKNIKVGGEGLTASEPNSPTSPERLRNPRGGALQGSTTLPTSRSTDEKDALEL